jgi:hypothetical protein
MLVYTHQKNTKNNTNQYFKTEKRIRFKIHLKIRIWKSLSKEIQVIHSKKEIQVKIVSSHLIT